jgi:hypothetical protein
MLADGEENSSEEWIGVWRWGFKVRFGGWSGALERRGRV